jgi:hypothetical protein
VEVGIRDQIKVCLKYLNCFMTLGIGVDATPKSVRVVSLTEMI